MQEKKYRLGQLVLGVVLMLFFISFSVTVTLNFRPLYHWDMKAMNLSAVSGLTEEQILRNYDTLIDYNNIWGPDTLVFPDLAMSESGRIHFEEVKRVFSVFEWMVPVTLVLGVAGIWCFHQKKQFLYLKYTALLSILVPAAIGIAMAVSWDTVFVTFHKIVFRNNLWIFDARTDPVITILPDTFFLHCAILIIAGVLIGSGICCILYLKKRKETEIVV